MSRAFTKENDGWVYCVKKSESCMFADEAGECSLAQCRHEQEKNKDLKQDKAKAQDKYKTIRLPL